jgi:hypothetical protein
VFVAIQRYPSRAVRLRHLEDVVSGGVEDPADAITEIRKIHAEAEAMEGFARKVAAARPGRGLAEGFRPSKVTFAILLKNGTDLTTGTLFPFSQVTLVQTAELLEAWGVAVEVTGIQAATVAPSRAGIRHLAA